MLISDSNGIKGNYTNVMSADLELSLYSQENLSSSKQLVNNARWHSYAIFWSTCFAVYNHSQAVFPHSKKFDEKRYLHIADNIHNSW